ncbi:MULTISPECIES: carbohydrate ABC transporter permease [unclassified Arthrobacter]|uniref:carbohydrate ABC transporter permease n=1 Tax=unclassified Arthrobacter TaxID=235627 RepID=UPI002DF79099|nr:MULTISPECIES: carbohydrate ABC transporter permease [unclassified Arthrobacter]MEC5189864.1 multiple sugar transport system permease protein [Arthrobacter sp. MP_M4]MEC5201331.1 multiple sugar transport system permease protein [Arthrobacter sp. MP_M7]
MATTRAQPAGTELPKAPAVDTAAETAPLRPRRKTRTPRALAARVLLWILLILISGAFLYPLAWLIAASLKPRAEVFDNALIPRTFSPQNYVQVWEQLPLINWVTNSFLIAVLAASLVTVSSAMVAFGFAYFRFPGRNLLFGLVLATMMLPGAVTMVPQYLIWKNLGVLGTWIPLFGMNLFGSAFYIFLQRQFFLGLPRELFEAARIDGASYFGLFRLIALPLSIPSLVVIFLFEFQASWNNLQSALIYLNAGSVEGFTAPLGIAYAMTKYSPTNGGQGDYQYVMVATLLITLPMLVLFAFGQRHFIEGVATEGRKG